MLVHFEKDTTPDGEMTPDADVPYVDCKVLKRIPMNYKVV